MEDGGSRDESQEPDIKPKLEDEDSIDGSDDDGIEFITVADPHLSGSARRRELEEEMSDDERKELVCGWEEFLPTASKRKAWDDLSPGPSRAKSEATGDVPHDPPLQTPVGLPEMHVCQL